MSRAKNYKAKKKQITALPKPQKALPAQSAQPFIGPPAPKSLKQQLGLPEYWTEDHVKMYNDMMRGGPVGAWNTLVKYTKKKIANDKDLPTGMIDMIIEVARKYLENKSGIDIETELAKAVRIP